MNEDRRTIDQAREIENLKATQGYNAKFSQVLAEQAQEIERLTVELLAARSACEAWGNQVVKEREQLAAMRQEREARIAELESKL